MAIEGSPTLPPFPEVWDSSIRSSVVACARQGYYAHILNLRKSGTSIHLHFGACIAKALEAGRKAYWGQGKDEIQAVAAACTTFIREWGDFEIPDSILATRSGVKTLEAGLDAVVSYFEQYPLGSDQVRPMMINGEPMVEKSFALQVPNTRHPVTGEPVVYAGRLDMLGEFDGAVFVVDEKTSLALGPTWRSNWTLRGQFSGYVWGVRSYDIEAAGCIIRGIGILKGLITFEQAIITRPQWQVDQWLVQLSRDINRFAEMWLKARELMEEGVNDFEDVGHIPFDQALDSACSSYGGCGYLGLCDSQNPRPWYDEYLRMPWNPLLREGDIP